MLCLHCARNFQRLRIKTENAADKTATCAAADSAARSCRESSPLKASPSASASDTQASTCSTEAPVNTMLSLVVSGLSAQTHPDTFLLCAKQVHPTASASDASLISIWVNIMLVLNP